MGIPIWVRMLKLLLETLRLGQPAVDRDTGLDERVDLRTGHGPLRRDLLEFALRVRPAVREREAWPIPGEDLIDREAIHDDRPPIAGQHLAPVVRHAMTMASRAFGTAWPTEAKLATRPATRRERKALEAHTTGRRSRGGTALATMRAIPGLRDKAAYVRALMVPDRSFLRERQGSGWKALVSRWRTTTGWLVGGKR